MSGLTSVGVPTQVDPSALQQTQFGSVDQGANAQHEQAFADAVARSAPVQQIDAQPALTGNGMMSNLTDRMDAIAQGFRTDPASEADMTRHDVLAPGDPGNAEAANADAAKPPETLKETMHKALESYSHTVMLSVEAQAMSNGISTSQKTFNNLEKGS
jgi:hypothetical protein